MRPGQLTDENGSGALQASEELTDWDKPMISRANVANFIVQIIDQENTYQKVIEMLDGTTPICTALQLVF